MSEFPAETLDRLRNVEEVRIETSAGPGAAVHRTIIWIIVDEQDRVLVRSVRGARGRWYREVVANPDCAILVGRERLEADAQPANDPDRIAATSQAFEKKYGADPAVHSMLRADILETTLELLPRG